MKRFALLVLFVVMAWVAWDGVQRQEWGKHIAAGGCLAAAMAAIGLLGEGGRRKNRRSPEVSAVSLEVMNPEGALELGQIIGMKVKVKSPRDLHLSHVIFDLVNRRFEKKAPLDRVVSQSNFVFRWDVDRNLDKGQEVVLDLPMRTLACREPTRESKYVSITWEILPVLHFAPAPGEKCKYLYEGTPAEIEFSGPQNY